jgi:IS30 family transposase
VSRRRLNIDSMQPQGHSQRAVATALGKSPSTISREVRRARIEGSCDDVIEHFRAQVEAEGVGYQTLINALLRKAIASSKKSKPEDKPLTVATLRKVLREERHTS